jgi:hypothetical protein
MQRQYFGKEKAPIFVCGRLVAPIFPHRIGFPSRAVMILL